ncbi:BA14K family protein [Sinorhizobium sp. 7-81]|nr:BA14K family protein [Sinorhizobium sp. 8-89]MDK1492079.1 BA14K family protein [Sinorhizobium sp. 8-89]
MFGGCFDHYRSYGAYDNIYQPYDGTREQSPYS